MPITRGTRRYPMLAGAEAAVVAYLLRATFGAADQGYADAQVLDTAAEGVQDGQLTVVEVDGTLAISGNECAFTAQSTPAWGDQGFYSQAITRALGRGLMGTVRLSTVSTSLPLSWWKSTTLTLANGAYAINPSATAQMRVWVDNAELIVILDTWVADTDYQFAIILGGFDSSGAPFYTGQAKANYTYGAWFLVKGGSFANWTLIWVTNIDNTATLYAAHNNSVAAGTID